MRDEPLLFDVSDAVEPEDVPVEEPVEATVPVVLEPEPVAVAFADPEPVVVADTEPVLEPEEEAEEVIVIVTDSEARQVAEKTLMADDSASPEHFSVMLPATCCSRVPQRLLRSDGLDWAPRAAIKQAGGVASATRARANIATKKVEAYMLTEFDGYLNRRKGGKGWMSRDGGAE